MIAFFFGHFLCHPAYFSGELKQNKNPLKIYFILKYLFKSCEFMFIICGICIQESEGSEREDKQ